MAVPVEPDPNPNSPANIAVPAAHPRYIRNEDIDAPAGRSLSGMLSSILLDIVPPPRPHMIPISTRPAMSGMT